MPSLRVRPHVAHTHAFLSDPGLSRVHSSRHWIVGARLCHGFQNPSAEVLNVEEIEKRPDFRRLFIFSEGRHDFPRAKICLEYREVLLEVLSTALRPLWAQVLSCAEKLAAQALVLRGFRIRFV